MPSAPAPEVSAEEVARLFLGKAPASVPQDAASDREQLYDLAYALRGGEGHQITRSVRLQDLLPVIESKFRQGAPVWLRPSGSSAWQRSDPRR